MSRAARSTMRTPAASNLRSVVVIAIPIAVSIAIFVSLAANAAVNRDITVTSNPPGATVYQLKGFRSSRLGQTPLRTSIPVPSDATVIRIAIEHAGFSRETAALTAANTSAAIDLKAIPLLKKSAGAQPLRQVLRAAGDLANAREEILAAFAPWMPIAPAEPALFGDWRFIVFRLDSASGNRRGSETDAVAERFAAAIAELPEFDGIDGILLSFERRVGGGVSTSVGTRLVTEMVCQGAMVPTPVWDSCATRSTTTSTTSSGTKTEYRCVGGTVTRQVYNPCARRVPQQKSVVDVRSEARTDVRRNAMLQIIGTASKAPKRLGRCEIRSGRARSVISATNPLVVAACNPDGTP